MKKSLLIFTILFGAFVFALAPNVYAMENPPGEDSFPTSGRDGVEYKYNNYFLYYCNDNNKYYMRHYANNEPFIVNVVSSENDTYFTFTPNKDITYYELFFDGSKWVYLGQGIAFKNQNYGFSLLVENANFVDSTFLIKRTDGTQFHPQPMYKEVQDSSYKNLKLRLNNLFTYDIRVLVVVGLGIMSLFIAIYLIPRILHKFM